MRVLVTGGRGFIGRALVHVLLEQGHDVHCIVRPGTDAETVVDVTVVELDLGRPLDTGRLPKAVDAVIHLAQSRQYRHFPEGAIDMLRVNTVAAVELAEYARAAGAHGYVLASTGSVYGSSADPLTETSPTAPADFYSASKLSAELLLRPYGGLMAVCILRLFRPYGPGQQGMLIPTVVERVAQGKTIVLNGRTEGHVLHPVFVDDVARLISEATTKRWSGVVNVAGLEPVYFRQLAETIGELLGKPPVFEINQSAEPTDEKPNIDKLKELIDTRQLTPLRDGLAATVNAYRAGDRA